MVRDVGSADVGSGGVGTGVGACSSIVMGPSYADVRTTISAAFDTGRRWWVDAPGTDVFLTTP
jgi:hypothetical protein